MKAIRWLLKLMLVMMTLPLILAVWLAKWFVVFLHHCSAWVFYLLGSVLLATAVLSYLLQQSQGMEALQMLIGGLMMVGATYHQIGNPTKIASYSSMLSRLAAMAGREAESLISMVLRAFLSIQFRSALVYGTSG